MGRLIPAAGVALLVLVLVGLLMWIARPRSLPDFQSIGEVTERKEAFFGFLFPYVREANEAVSRQRERLKRYAGWPADRPYNRRDRFWLEQLGASYGLELAPGRRVDPDWLADLRRRVDLIPPSLALAQAALESAWGTSRFAREGNNLFGTWCTIPGCGIIPRHRPPGRTYEVKAYRSPGDSFADYFRNLNSNPAYEPLWDLRIGLREDGEPLTGEALCDGLFRYSEEGWTYVRKVRNMIRTNQLETYDKAMD